MYHVVDANGWWIIANSLTHVNLNQRQRAHKLMIFPALKPKFSFCVFIKFSPPTTIVVAYFFCLHTHSFFDMHIIHTVRMHFWGVHCWLRYVMNACMHVSLCMWSNYEILNPFGYFYVKFNDFNFIKELNFYCSHF